MKIPFHFEDEIIRLNLHLETKVLVHHAQLTDNLDARADIHQILNDTARAISQLIRLNDKK